MQISLEKLQAAEKVIFKGVQYEAFNKEHEVLRVVSKPGEELSRDQAGKRKDEIKKTSSLYRLDPFLDEDGILRVGGRIKRGNIPLELKNPIILPRKGHVTEMIIRYYHNNTVERCGIFMQRFMQLHAAFLQRCGIFMQRDEQ